MEIRDPNLECALTQLLGKNIIVLALTTCCFEGSLFLFIFFKFPALTLAHKQAGTSGGKLAKFLIFERLLTIQTRAALWSNIRNSHVFDDVRFNALQAYQQPAIFAPSCPSSHVYVHCSISMLVRTGSHS
jgi:hypothetical protein